MGASLRIYLANLTEPLGGVPYIAAKIRIHKSRKSHDEIDNQISDKNYHHANGRGKQYLFAFFHHFRIGSRKYKHKPADNKHQDRNNSDKFQDQVKNAFCHNENMAKLASRLPCSPAGNYSVISYGLSVRSGIGTGKRNQ